MNESTSVNSWTAEQFAFQAWLALPPASRKPRQQKQLAAELGVDECTLSRWKKLDGWNDVVYELVIHHLNAELGPILHAQAAQAKRGSLPHAQWLFELANKWAPRTKMEHSGPGGGAIPVREILVTLHPDDADAALPDPS